MNLKRRKMFCMQLSHFVRAKRAHYNNIYDNYNNNNNYNTDYSFCIMLVTKLEIGNDFLPVSLGVMYSIKNL